MTWRKASIRSSRFIYYW